MLAVKKNAAVFIAVLLVTLLFAASPALAEGEAFRVESTGTAYAALADAIGAAAETDTVTMLADAAVDSTAAISGKTITLAAAEGTAPVLTRGKNFGGAFITVAKDASVAVEGIVFDGDCGGFAPDFDNIGYATSQQYAVFEIRTDADFRRSEEPIITSAGTLSLTDVTLKNSASSQEKGHGGALRVTGGTVTAEDSLFSHNTAMACGAVYVENASSASFSGCVFEDNFARHLNETNKNPGPSEAYCGAIGFDDVETIVFTDCEFNDNTVSRGTCGAIGVNPTHGSTVHGGNLTVTRCAFNRNIVGNDGFAMELVSGVTATVSDCTFTGNKGLAKEGQSTGTIALRGTKNTRTLNVYNCVFRENSGGASVLTDHGDWSFITVERCDFIDNTGLKTVHLFCSNSTFTDCNFEGNKGVAIELCSIGSGSSKPTCDILRCDFNENEWSGVYTHAAALFVNVFNNDPRYTNPHTVTVRESSFTDNEGGLGGAIRIEDGSDTTIENCTVTGNKADNRSGGGALSTDSNAKVTLNNVTMKENSTVRGGGAIYATGASAVTARNVLITRNSADYGGGGLYVMGGAQLDFSDSTNKIYDNHGVRYADDVFLTADKTLLTLPEVGTQNVWLNYWDAYPVDTNTRKCNHKIDGWYMDTPANRWNADDEAARYIELVYEPAPYKITDDSEWAFTGSGAPAVLIKAAHGINAVSPKPTDTNVPSGSGVPEGSGLSGGTPAPEPEQPTAPPQTGDASVTGTALLLMAAAAAAAAFLRRKQHS